MGNAPLLNQDHVHFLCQLQWGPLSILQEAYQELQSLECTHREFCLKVQAILLRFHTLTGDQEETLYLQTGLLPLLEDFCDFLKVAQKTCQDPEVDQWFWNTWEAFGAEFSRFDLAALSSSLQASEKRRSLHLVLDGSFPLEKLEEGYYADIQSLLAQVTDISNVRISLEQHLTRVRQLLDDHNREYYLAGDWTVTLSLADALLQEGLEMWEQALEHLIEAVESQDDSMKNEAFELMLDANHNFLHIEQWEKPSYQSAA